MPARRLTAWMELIGYSDKHIKQAITVRRHRFFYRLSLTLIDQVYRYSSLNMPLLKYRYYGFIGYARLDCWLP